MIRLFPPCLVIAAALALASCSAIDFAYNNAAPFVAREIDDALDLNDQQRAQLDAELQQFFSWHRQHELLRYQQLLNAAAQAVEDGITAREFLDISNDLRLAWRRSFTRIIDGMGWLMTTLTPEQIDHYQRYFREKTEEYDDYLQMSMQQREIFQVEKGIKRLEEWFGSFDEIEREKISARLLQLPEFYLPWIGYREARHQALVDALRSASSVGLSPQQLHAILLDPDTEYARAFEPVRRAYWQAYAHMIEDISGWNRKAQLRHAVERLRDYADISAGLANDN